MPALHWWSLIGRELPELLAGDWRAEPIAAGYWLCHADEPPQPPVPPCPLAVEEDRMALLVDGDTLDARAAVGISAFLAHLPPASPRAVRLISPLVDMRIAQRMAEHERIDLISTDGCEWHRFRTGQPPQQLGRSHPQADTDDQGDPYSQIPSPALLRSLTTLIPG